MANRYGHAAVPRTPNSSDENPKILPAYIVYSCTQCNANNRIEGEEFCKSCQNSTKRSPTVVPVLRNAGKQPGSPQIETPNVSNLPQSGLPHDSISSRSAGGNIQISDDTNEADHMVLVGQTIQVCTSKCIVRGKFNCNGEQYYAIESDKSMKGYDGLCPKCRQQHVHFAQPKRGYYALVSEIQGKIYGDALSDQRAKGPKEISELPFETGDRPPLGYPSPGKDKGIEGDSNSCYMDSTIFCMFAYSRVFDSLLHMDIGHEKTVKTLQKLLRENIVNILRSKKGFVERDALFHLRSLLSEATGDQSFKEMEKDPTEFLRALEGLFQYAPLETIVPDQPPNETRSNVTTNIMWEMFDANPHQLSSISIGDIFRNSLAEIPAKLATIPPFLILIAPRHTRSERSYRYIIPDRQIVLDHKIVQLVCLECKQTNENSHKSRDFYFCQDCYSKNSSASSTPITDTTVMCYCYGCLQKLHKVLPREALIERHQPRQMKGVTYKLNLFAVLCIEKCHYVAFVKCRKADQEHEWLFFDSMSDRIQNEKNVARVSPVPRFDQWIEKSETDVNFFKDIDRRRSQGKPMSQEFSEDEIRQLRLFRDGAFFFYENSDIDYQ